MQRWQVTLLIAVLIIGGGTFAVTQGLVPGVNQPQIERPLFDIADMGDWGAVSEDQTEIIHTFWIQNPNPAGVNVGDAITLSYQATINDVQLARGEKTGFVLQNGNNTIQARTYLANDQIAPWWVNFIQNNETLTYDVQSSATVRAGLSYQANLPRQNGSDLNNSTPVETALDAAASGLEGRYACSAGGSGSDVCLNAGTSGTGEQVRAISPDATVGIEITDGRARWGEVTQEETNITFQFDVRNVGDVPVLLDARHLGASVALNDNELVRVTRANHSLRGVDQDAAIAPGETRTVTYVVTMQNENVDEWFTSHVRRDEASQVDIQLQLVFSAEGSDVSLRVPEEGGVRYECQFQTGILVDNQESSTTCGSGGSVSVGPVDVDFAQTGDAEDSSTDTPTATATSETATETATLTSTSTSTETSTDQNRAPTADVTASPTSGSAPLTVTFDASGSTDPDGDIQEYVWRFDDGSPPQNGETVEHTFETAGTYRVEVTAIDAAGNRDTATVTITVESGSDIG